MSDIELPDLPEKIFMGTSRFGSVFYGYIDHHLTEFARAAILADREKRAQAAPHARDAITWTPETGYVFATEASKPVQDHIDAPVNMVATKQAEAPSDDADPLTPEQEEWVMDLAEKHNLGRRMSGSTPRGLAPDVFYTDASYRTYELFCFAAELLKSRGASDV